ncbi:MAG: hypothetical protein M0P72_09750 [Metallibacterium scheffleri]|jgi:hypothetical protein|uniref:hypothetical protein n=1 Tax=Metallibacterium scheffleri TaxID=993689 RepID=UPI0026F041CD|nr:hypothetical protein [Metallibacterium scheffleri]MCK9367414.1 hypothetical protein [Metallibacterium scheffleri]
MNALMQKLMGPPIGGPAGATMAGEMIGVWRIDGRDVAISRAVLEDASERMDLLWQTAERLIRRSAAGVTQHEVLEMVCARRSQHGVRGQRVAVEFVVRCGRVEVRLAGEG